MVGCIPFEYHREVYLKFLSFKSSTLIDVVLSPLADLLSRGKSCKKKYMQIIWFPLRIVFVLPFAEKH